MGSALLFALLAFAAVALAIVIPVLFRLYRHSPIEEITPEWLEHFSPESYEPMARLLSRDDFNFLKRQPGFDTANLRRFRRDRLRIFRQYLNRIVVDFNRLHLAARVLVAHSTDDRSALMNRLVSLKFRFGLALLRAELGYVLCLAGANIVSVRALVARLDEMSVQLNALSLSSSAAY